MSEPTERGLGRLFRPDPRDRAYALAAPAEASGIERRAWHAGFTYDQGGTSQCVAYSGVGWLRAGPVPNRAPLDFREIYDACQAVDEWPGAEPDYFGTSVRALFKVLRARGFVSEYRWAWDAETVVAHLLAKGPVVVGTTWTDGMSRPDADGFVRPTGAGLGGHAYLLVGANRARRVPWGGAGAVRILNSWGRGWGENGRAWLSFEDLHALLRDHGEAATATEVQA